MKDPQNAVIISVVMSLSTSNISAHENAARLFLRLFNVKRVMTERGGTAGSHMLKDVMIGIQTQPDCKPTHV